MRKVLKRYLGSIILVSAISARVLAAPTATTTTLAVTSAGQISEGHFVTFVATVKNPAPVAQGAVYFCRSRAALCFVSGGSYGTAHLTSSGTATLQTRLNTSDSTVTAVFVGTRENLGSTSAVTAVTVASEVVYPSITNLASSGAPNSYTLSGSVRSFGKEQMKGTIELLNTIDNNAQIASAFLSNPLVNLSNSVPYNVGRQPTSVVTGDFNGDGIPDLVVANETDNNISVLLGNGDGTFKQQVTWTTEHTPESITVGDFNGDGIQDLAVANTNGNCVSILLGNGDGSFQNQIVFSTGIGPVSIATSDFNGDGIADLAVANVSNADLSILLGNGDGTFQEAYAVDTGRSPLSVATGDLNSDGFVDLIVANNADDTVSILLGNGDGTFQPQTTAPTGASPYALVAADLNNDRILDLAVANRGDGTVSILVGKGNGSFQNPSSAASGRAPDAVAVGDFNGDGIPDIAVCNQFDSTISVVLGNGDATFRSPQTYAVGFFNGQSLAVGDFNGDGLVDLASTDVAELNVQLGQQVATFSTSDVSNLGSGTNWVLASYPGDNIRFPSQSLTVSLIGMPDTATVTLFSAPNPASFGTVVTLSATVAGGSVVPPTGQVVFKDGTTVLGTSTISGATATITTDDLAVGTHSISAVYTGDTSYRPATSVPLVQTVSKATAAIGLVSSINPSVYGDTIIITATITKGATGTIAFMDGQNIIGSSAVNGEGNAVISTSNLVAGLHTITAIYSGDRNFE
jgi:Bacterial Ig-like domain (group 3)/FG-GAP-like repeat